MSRDPLQPLVDELARRRKRHRGIAPILAKLTRARTAQLRREIRRAAKRKGHGPLFERAA